MQAQTNQHFIAISTRIRPLTSSRPTCVYLPPPFGAQPSKWFGLLLNMPFLGSFLNGCLRYSTSYGDLCSHSILGELRESTVAFAERNPEIPALRSATLWGDAEDTVAHATYRYDTSRIAPGRNHITVCKPDNTYLLPLSFVRHRVQRSAFITLNLPTDSVLRKDIRTSPVSAVVSGLFERYHACAFLEERVGSLLAPQLVTFQSPKLVAYGITEECRFSRQ